MGLEVERSSGFLWSLGLRVEGFLWFSFGKLISKVCLGVIVRAS